MHKTVIEQFQNNFAKLVRIETPIGNTTRYNMLYYCMYMCVEVEIPSCSSEYTVCFDHNNYAYVCGHSTGLIHSVVCSLLVATFEKSWIF